MVLCNPCVGPSRRIKVYLLLLPICTEPKSAPKAMTFFPMLLSVNENSERESIPMPSSLYLNISGLAYLVRFTDPNKQLFNVKSVFKFRNHGLSV